MTTLIALETIEQLTLSAPPASRPKIWHIPYQRNPVFTGRDDLLNILATVLSVEQTAALSQPQAISGLGGIGKTQLAVEYAYRYAQRYQMAFWVSSETQERLVSGYAQIAEALVLHEKDEQDQRLMVSAVRQWLQTHTSWLLILDNADDLSLVQSFLPPVCGGHVILTTRAWATGRFAHRIEIDTLKRKDGALLLLRRAGVLSPQESLENAPKQQVRVAHQISEALGDLPLALDQAGAYIEETGCSLSDYLQRYRERRTMLLQRRGALATDHPEPVTTTWSLSFEQVEQRDPVAADLLRFCACLAPDAIPEQLLVNGSAELGAHLESIASDSSLLDEAIGTLLRFSFVKRDSEEQTVVIHRLVQYVMSIGMDETTQRLWAERTVCAICRAFPDVTDPRAWSRCQQYLPHAQAAVLFMDHWQETLPEMGALLTKMGYYLDERAQYEQAEPLYQRALTVYEQSLGVKHLDTAAVVCNLAELYVEEGKYG